MKLTVEQLKAAEQGKAVKIEAGGQKYVLLSQSVYEDTLDYSPWSTLPTSATSWRSCDD